MLGTLDIPQIERDIGQAAHDCRFVQRILARAQHGKADAAVKGAGIHVQIAQLLRKAFGKGAFSRSGGAVDRD